MDKLLFRKYDGAYHIIGVRQAPWPPPHDMFIRDWKFRFSMSDDIADHLSDGFDTAGVEDGMKKWKPLDKMKPRIMRYAIRMLFKY